MWRVSVNEDCGAEKREKGDKRSQGKGGEGNTMLQRGNAAYPSDSGDCGAELLKSGTYSRSRSGITI